MNADIPDPSRIIAMSCELLQVSDLSSSGFSSIAFIVLLRTIPASPWEYLIICCPVNMSVGDSFTFIQNNRSAFMREDHKDNGDFKRRNRHIEEVGRDRIPRRVLQGCLPGRGARFSRSGYEVGESFNPRDHWGSSSFSRIAVSIRREAIR